MWRITPFLPLEWPQRRLLRSRVEVPYLIVRHAYTKMISIAQHTVHIEIHVNVVVHNKIKKYNDLYIYSWNSYLLLSGHFDFPSKNTKYRNPEASFNYSHLGISPVSTVNTTIEGSRRVLPWYNCTLTKTVPFNHKRSSRLIWTQHLLHRKRLSRWTLFP